MITSDDLAILDIHRVIFHDVPLSNPEQNTRPEIAFTVSVDDNDNLTIVALGARDVTVSISQSHLADDIIRALVQR